MINSPFWFATAVRNTGIMKLSRYVWLDSRSSSHHLFVYVNPKPIDLVLDRSHANVLQYARKLCLGGLAIVVGRGTMAQVRCSHKV